MYDRVDKTEAIFFSDKPKPYFFSQVGCWGEEILKILPRGTHNIKNSQTRRQRSEDCRFKAPDISGITTVYLAGSIKMSQQPLHTKEKLMSEDDLKKLNAHILIYLTSLKIGDTERKKPLMVKIS